MTKQTKYFLVGLTICINHIAGFSQQIKFQKIYKDIYAAEGSFIKEVSGGYIYTGMGYSGSYHVAVVKLNYNGDTLWTRTIGGTGSEGATSVVETNDGGYVIAGQTTSFGSGGYADAFMTKFDVNGNLLWSKTYGDTCNEGFQGLTKTNSNELIAIGTKGHGAYSDWYIVKTDNNGNLLWSKTYGDTAQYVYDNGYAIQQTNDGNFIAAGLGAQSVIKINPSGNLIWSVLIGGLTGYPFIEQISTNGYLVIGNSTIYGFGLEDIFLIKLDSVGNEIWSKTYGTAQHEEGYNVHEISGNNFILSGEYSLGDKALLLKTDSSGNVLWAKTYTGLGNGGSEGIGIPTSDNGYIFGGKTNNNLNGAAYFIKTDSMGNSGCNQQSIIPGVSIPPVQCNPVNIITQSANTLVVNFSPTFFPTAYTKTTNCYSIGIEEIENKISLTIFPNPFTDQTILRSDNWLNKATLTIYNYLGQTIQEVKNISGQTITLSRDNLSSGLYFVRLTQDNKIIATDKLIITD